MQNSQWFTDHIGQVVMRFAPDGSKRSFDISDNVHAEYASSLQEHGYTYSDVVQ